MRTHVDSAVNPRLIPGKVLTITMFWSVAAALLVACSQTVPQSAAPVVNSPTAIQTLSPTFLTSEAVYNARVAAGELPTTISPLPTATPHVFPSAEDATFVIYQGRAAYQAEPEFQVAYRTEQWRLSDYILVHQMLPSCQLDLMGIGMEMLTRAIEHQQQLAGYTWEARSFPPEQTISYSTAPEEGTYLFLITYAPSLTPEQVEQCHFDSEAVLDTFAVVE